MVERMRTRRMAGSRSTSRSKWRSSTSPTGCTSCCIRSAAQLIAKQALVYLRYYVGSKDDPQGLTGFAHLYEHLIFRGSRNAAASD